MFCGLNRGIPGMRQNYLSPLLFLLLLTGCSKADRGTEIPEGHLELVWAVQPEGSEDELLVEPWFARIADIAVGNEQIFVADIRRNNVLVLNEDGSYHSQLGREGRGPGEHSRAAIITISPSGSVYVQSQRYGQLNAFSGSGEFLRFWDFQQLGSEAGDSTPEFPVALNDTSFVFDYSPRFGPDFSFNERLNSPLLLQFSEDAWKPLGRREISEVENAARESIIERPDDFYVQTFTRVKKSYRPSTNELLLVKVSDPYTITRVLPDGSQKSFTYLNVKRDNISDWIQVVKTTREETDEYMQGREWLEHRLLGEHGIFLPEQDSRQMLLSFTFTHTCRGLALFHDTLVIFVEVLHSDYVTAAPEERLDNIDQLLFLVNLQSEQAELQVPVSISGFPELEGVLSNGTYIFRVELPYPGIMAYRIVPN